MLRRIVIIVLPHVIRVPSSFLYLDNHFGHLTCLEHWTTLPIVTDCFLYLNDAMKSVEEARYDPPSILDELLLIADCDQTEMGDPSRLWQKYIWFETSNHIWRCWKSMRKWSSISVLEGKLRLASFYEIIRRRLTVSRSFCYATTLIGQSGQIDLQIHAVLMILWKTTFSNI